MRADEVGVAIRCRCSSSVIPEIDIPVISSERSDERSVVRRAAFTLVELVITIAIVIILSVISVPIYRGYVDKAKWTEGYALLGVILSAQKAYYGEYGNFLRHQGENGSWTIYDPILGIDARGNKWFTSFHVGQTIAADPKTYFDAAAYKTNEEGALTIDALELMYNITKGMKISTKWDGSWQN